MQTCRTGMRFHGIFFAAVRVLSAHSDRDGLRKYSFARVVIQHSETISSALCMDCAAEDWLNAARARKSESRVRGKQKTAVQPSPT